MTYEEVLTRIDELRDERGWSGYRLAREAEMSYSTYYNMMQRSTYPKFETLEKLCRGFHISLSEFFARDDMVVELSEDEKFLLENYRKSDRDGRAQLIGYASAVSEKKN